jgi:hypothetical protein
MTEIQSSKKLAWQEFKTMLRAMNWQGTLEL